MCVDVPDAFHGGQDELIHDASAWFQDAHHGEGFVGVDIGLVCEAMRAEKRIAQSHVQLIRHARTQRHFKRRLP